MAGARGALLKHRDREQSHRPKRGDEKGWPSRVRSAAEGAGKEGGVELKQGS